MAKRTKTTTTKVAKASKLSRKVAQQAPASPRARTRTKRQLAMAMASPASSAPSSPASSVPSGPVASMMLASFVAALTPSPVLTPPSSTAAKTPLSSSCLPVLGWTLRESASTRTTPQQGVLLSAPATPSLSPLLPVSPRLSAYLTGGSLVSPRPSLSPTGTASDGISNELVGAESQRTKFKSVIRLNGFQYTKAGTPSKKVTYRSHVCHQGPVVPNLRNVEKEMKDAVDDMALQNLSMSAERVWETVRDTFYLEEDVAVHGLSREQVRQRVSRVRREYFGGSMHGLVEVPPLSLVQGSAMSFFQFHRVYAHKGSNDTKVERLIGGGHPVIIDKLKNKGATVFVDGTFRCVPQPFYQCVVIMVHDQASDCFLPAFYVLCSSKESGMYCNVIDHVIQATDQKLNPAKVICDFESGLIKAMLTQFPDAKVSGCYFHFKQALGRQMKKL
ncbi:unnamed protein product [Phytophthora fragariaefolia]|uniref:Unnamed protein product n=1 Tax=Phytophthora fragariaefolia TaxID=1490495 RepID=A0A9W7CPP7_9STRA|nr:unnamed protein product [Phytophthora fragariaefolia]